MTKSPPVVGRFSKLEALTWFVNTLATSTSPLVYSPRVVEPRLFVRRKNSCAAAGVIEFETTVPVNFGLVS